jgi:hypothetical protein
VGCGSCALRALLLRCASLCSRFVSLRSLRYRVIGGGGGAEVLVVEVDVSFRRVSASPFKSRSSEFDFGGYGSSRYKWGDGGVERESEKSD